MQRLRVHASGRYLERDGGTPFLYLADTAWELFHRLDREEADAYLRDRAGKGFTVVQAVVLAELDGLDVPNATGAIPLEDRDPERPMEAYFEHVDWITNRANELGLVVGMLPTWGRYWKHNGDRPGDTIFTETNARAYGEWLAKRYQDADLIWILGGDRDVDTQPERALLAAMASGLRSGDGGAHLCTFHPRGPGRSAEEQAGATWIDFHMAQSSHAAPHHDTGLYIQADRAADPARPALDGEPHYEGIPVGFYLRGMNPAIRFTDYDARQAAWWAMLAGACGHTYGNNNVWQMWDTDREPIIQANTPWYEAIQHPGARQMGYLRRLLERVRWWELEPAPCGGDFLLSAPLSGAAKVRAALTPNGGSAVVYSPAGEAFTLDLGALARRNTQNASAAGPDGDGATRSARVGSRRVRETWFDPRYGTFHELHTGSDRGIQTYTPPNAGPERDWVLVLERETPA